MSFWELKYNDDRKSFEDWGLSGLHMRSRNGRFDQVSFVQDGVRFDEDEQFANKQEIVIYRDDLQWFVGRLRNPRRLGSAEAEHISYVAEGVLVWLDHLVFMQPWKYFTNPNIPDSDKYTYFLSDLVLFQKIVGLSYEIANVKEQVEEIFQYIADKWDADSTDPKFQLDASLLPTHQAPFMEISNITCGMALELALRTCPDIALWTDYSTTPPTIKIARRADLEAKELTVYEPGENPGIEDEDDSEISHRNIKVEVEPRYDLQVPAVVIDYKQTVSVNGNSNRYTTRDIFPIGSVPDNGAMDFDVLPQSVNLEGTNVSFPIETLLVRAIAKDSAAWWKLQDTSLARTFAQGSSVEIRNLTIRGATRNGSLPYEVLPNSGPWAPWMGGTAEEDIIEAYVSYDVYESRDGGEVHRTKITDELAQARIMTTNKASGVYQGNATGTVGEPVPVGMAQALYVAASELHYEGTIVFEEDECSGQIKVGNVINIINSKRPEWATARMFVQEVEQDIDEGRTTITVGPPKFLGVNELMDWMRGLRSANSGMWASRVSGQSFNGGSVQIASRAHKQTLNAGKQAIERMVLMRPDSAEQTTQTLTAMIVLDILHALGKQIEIREWKVCVDGVSKYALVLSSDIYSSPLTSTPLG
jgi:hypothetical protein